MQSKSYLLSVLTGGVLVAVAFAGFDGFGGIANAAVIKNLEFNVDGVLPSSDPDISLSNNTGNPESSLYSVSGGFLLQRSFGINGNASYGMPNGNPTGGSLTPALSLSMEARLRINQIEGLAGAFFQALDGTHRYSVFFSPGAVELETLGPGRHVISLDISEFHTYRIQSDCGTNAFDFYIDDALVFSGLAEASTGANGFNFGDGQTPAGHSADADWDFVRFSQPAAVAAVAEPMTLAISLLGLTGIASLRRRRLLLTLGPSPRE